FLQLFHILSPLNERLCLPFTSCVALNPFLKNEERTIAIVVAEVDARDHFFRQRSFEFLSFSKSCFICKLKDILLFLMQRLELPGRERLRRSKILGLSQPCYMLRMEDTVAEVVGMVVMTMGVLWDLFLLLGGCPLASQGPVINALLVGEGSV